MPEIYDNTVVIRAIAREAGERTKIAVMSRDKDVDPVGACVGMKGMRVQSIIRELRGEKIDIIEFSEEITTFAEKALQPAKVSRVSITDLTDKQLEVIVDDTQLSLAIGKKGQNVRLAAKLLGWKIDIKSEEEKRQEVEQQMQALSGGPSTPIEQVTELGEGIIQKLVAAGITTVEALADMTPEQLEEIPGIGEKTLERISVAVRHYFGHFEEGEEGAERERRRSAGALKKRKQRRSDEALTAAADDEGKPRRRAGGRDGRRRCGRLRKRSWRTRKTCWKKQPKSEDETAENLRTTNCRTWSEGARSRRKRPKKRAARVCVAIGNSNAQLDDMRTTRQLQRSGKRRIRG